MAKQLDLKANLPLEICKPTCPRMSLQVETSDLFGDGEIVERVVTLSCEHEAVCRMQHETTLKDALAKLEELHETEGGQLKWGT